MQGTTTTPRQLYDLFCKGVKNEFLRTFVTTHIMDESKPKEWFDLAEHLSTVIDNNRDKDTPAVGPSIPLTGAPTVVAKSAAAANPASKVTANAAATTLVQTQ